MALLGAKMKPTVGFGTMLALRGRGSLGFAAAVVVFETRAMMEFGIDVVDSRTAPGRAGG